MEIGVQSMRARKILDTQKVGGNRRGAAAEAGDIRRRPPYPSAMDTRPSIQDDDRYEPQDETTEERTRRLAREDKAIDEALVSAAAGRTVSFEAVREWVNSWDTDHELPPPSSRRPK
jgi:predicted transcriptional regulator